MYPSRPFDPPSPAQIRQALAHHLARKLGWSGRTAAHCLGPLSHDDIARCLAVAPDATRAALFARSCRAIAAAAQPGETA